MIKLCPIDTVTNYAALLLVLVSVGHHVLERVTLDLDWVVVLFDCRVKSGINLPDRVFLVVGHFGQ